MSLPPEQFRSRTGLVALALLFMTTAFILAKTGRDALYFQDRGIFQLPIVYISITMLTPLMAMIILALMRSVGPRAARLLVPLLVAGLLVMYSFLATAGGGILNTMFFMLIPLAWGVLFSMSWLLAADLLEKANTPQLARGYSLIAAASILGGVFGSALAHAMSNYLEPRHLVIASAVSLVVSTTLLALAQRSFPSTTRVAIALAEPRQRMPHLPEYFEVLRGKYSGLLFVLAVLTGLVGVLVEFQFYLAAAASGNTGQENARFFASFYFVLSGAALLVQVFVTPRVQRLLGVPGSLLILPVFMMAGAAALVAMGGSIALRSGVRVAEGGLKSSVHRSNWEQTYLAVERTKRVMAKVVIDGMGTRLGEGLAGVLLLIWLEFVIGSYDIVGQDISWVSYTLLIGALAWVLLTRKLKQRFTDTGATDEVQIRSHQNIPLPDS